MELSVVYCRRQDLQTSFILRGRSRVSRAPAMRPPVRRDPYLPRIALRLVFTSSMKGSFIARPSLIAD
jgi:hypothetical protein